MQHLSAQEVGDVDSEPSIDGRPIAKSLFVECCKAHGGGARYGDKDSA